MESGVIAFLVFLIGMSGILASGGRNLRSGENKFYYVKHLQRSTLHGLMFRMETFSEYMCIMYELIYVFLCVHCMYYENVFLCMHYMYFEK